MLFSLSLTSCDLIFKDEKPNDDVTNDGNDNGNNEGGWQVPEGEYTIPKEEGHNQITFYWSHPGVIENCDIWAWWDGKATSCNFCQNCRKVKKFSPLDTCFQKIR